MSASFQQPNRHGDAVESDSATLRLNDSEFLYAVENSAEV